MTKRKWMAVYIVAATIVTGGPAYPFDGALYQKILDAYVHPDTIISGVRMNVVDYEGLLKEKKDPGSDFSRLLKGLESFDPNAGTTVDERVAFWINAYNIGAINLILTHYPIDSIRSMHINIFKNPWGEKAIRVGGAWYSLERIEHGILLGTYGKKRAHFGIVCASVSCPELSRRAYTGKGLDAQLERQARKFFRSPRKGIAIDRAGATVRVSSIFKFDSKSFPRGREDIIPFILPFIVSGEDRDYLIKAQYRLVFLPYDWGINGLAGAR